MKKKLIVLLIALFFIIPNVPTMKTVHAVEMDPEYATPKHGIPVLYLNIDESKGTVDAMNKSADHSVKCYGTVDVKSPSTYKSEYTGTTFADVTGLELEYMRGRGNSSWQQAQKKPYKLKFKDKVDFFGMGKSKDWVLLANALENSFIRNRMTFWLGDQVGMQWSPQSVPVELVVNGKYYGLYYLSEQVKIEESRLNIDKLSDTDTSGAEVTGGYIIDEIDYEDSDVAGSFPTKNNMRFVISSPDFTEKPNSAQEGYIKDYLQKTEDAIFGKDFKDSEGKSYKEYLDIQSAADYWWIQNISQNVDAYHNDSTHLYKKRIGKLYWGPLWDFDSPCWGNLMYDESVPTYEWMWGDCFWMQKMREDDEFVAVLKERWKVFDAKLAELTKSGGQIDKYYNELKTAYSYNAAKWGYYHSQVNSFEGEVKQLKNWIDKRRAWISKNLDQLKAYSGKNEWINGQWYDSYGDPSYEYKGSWKSDAKGWWFEDTSGWYAKNEWQKIDGKWYYFTADGYMDYREYREGCWLGSDGAWDETYSGGHWMQDSKGWWYEDNGWYPKDQKLWIDGVEYYFDASGYWK